MLKWWRVDVSVRALKHGWVLDEGRLAGVQDRCEPDVRYQQVAVLAVDLGLGALRAHLEVREAVDELSTGFEQQTVLPLGDQLAVGVEHLAGTSLAEHAAVVDARLWAGKRHWLDRLRDSSPVHDVRDTPSAVGPQGDRLVAGDDLHVRVGGGEARIRRGLLLARESGDQTASLGVEGTGADRGAVATAHGLVVRRCVPSGRRGDCRHAGQHESSESCQSETTHKAAPQIEMGST